MTCFEVLKVNGVHQQSLALNDIHQPLLPEPRLSWNMFGSVGFDEEVNVHRQSVWFDFGDFYGEIHAGCGSRDRGAWGRDAPFGFVLVLRFKLQLCLLEKPQTVEPAGLLYLPSVRVMSDLLLSDLDCEVFA